MKVASIALVGALLATPGIAMAAPMTGADTVAPSGTSYAVRTTGDDQEPGRLGARVGGKAGGRFGGRLNKNVNGDDTSVNVPPDFRDPWASLEYRLKRFDQPQ